MRRGTGGRPEKEIMRTTYRTLAWLIMALVAIQAAVVAYGFFGLGAWIESGNDMTKTVLEGGGGFTGEVGLMVHSIVGQWVIPVLALVMLLLSFFAHVQDGVRWGALLFVATVVQVLLGIVSFGAPTVGILHGLNAFLIFWLALMATRVTSPTTERARKRVLVRAQ